MSFSPVKFLLGVALLFAADGARAAAVPLAELDDTVNPGSAAYLIRVIDEAERAGAPAVAVRVNTPGGLLTATRQIIQRILAARIPVLVYVGPSGAHAGSAGALIALSADVLAMAPGTNLGAAHPVSADGSDVKGVAAQKAENDTAAFAESVAKARGRNADWAGRAVRKSESVPPDRALAEKVIDFVAADLTDFLAQSRNRALRVPRGGLAALPQDLGPFVTVPMTLKEKVVSFFANPTVAYLIMSIGALCLYLELGTPGAVVPGVVGAVCILLSLVSFQLLPIDYGALALCLVGIGLLIAETFVPAFGVLGLGGLTCFVLGSLFLVDRTAPELRISPALVMPTALVLAGGAFLIAYLVAGSRRRKVASGIETMIGAAAVACDDFDALGRGQAFVAGERWSATTLDGSQPRGGTALMVERVEGLLVWVRPTVERATAPKPENA